MSSTRRATRPGKLRQERFASSAAIVRGMLGNLVAKRCTRVHSQAARETIYFLQDLSHREPHLRHGSCNLFPAWPWPSDGPDSETALEKVARELAAEHGLPAEVRENLPAFFIRLCLDASFPAENAATPGFPGIMGALRAYRLKWEAAARARAAQTTTTRAVWEILDYALEQKGMVLAEGAYRTGKSFSAQAWAQAHLGRCRYVQLTSARDEAAFYREIARAVGVAHSFTMKGAQMRERIEAVLREQHLLLIIDEADWLWPQGLTVKETPHRLCWVLTSLCNAGVPVALIGSRNFSRLEANLARRPRLFGLEQFHGRLKLRVQLPSEPTQADLFLIAAATLPEADERTKTLLVAHALKSPVPVPAIEAAAARATYFATEAGRAQVTLIDMERTMIEAGTVAPGVITPAPARMSKPGTAAAPARPSHFRIPGEPPADAPRPPRASPAAR